jgi:DNA-binding NtrC family response regulator
MAPSSRSPFHGPDRPCNEIGVLIVDEDAPFRDGLAALLREDEHLVRQYAGPQALPALETLSWVGILVAARWLPDADGLAFADRFHGAHPDCSVLLLTAYRTRTAEAEAALRPFIRLIEKPIDYDDLHAQVHALAR